MTNIIAAIIITISTNWVPIGTFTPVVGWPTESVERGNIVTNTTLICEWNKAKREFILESMQGPSVGERRVPAPTSRLTIGTNTTWGIYPVIISNHVFNGTLLN